MSKTYGQVDENLQDEYTPSVTVISEPHRLIHDGMFFDMTGLGTGLANGASYDILFQFPAGVVGHLVNVEYTFDDAPVTIEFFENPTFSAAGTACNVQNHNRLNNNLTSSTVTHSPTVSDPGTLLSSRYVPSPAAQGGQAAGQMVAGEDYEWVLGLGNNYMWRITNNSGAAIDFGYHFNGYQPNY